MPTKISNVSSQIIKHQPDTRHGRAPTFAINADFAAASRVSPREPAPSRRQKSHCHTAMFAEAISCSLPHGRSMAIDQVSSSRLNVACPCGRYVRGPRHRRLRHSASLARISTETSRNVCRETARIPRDAHPFFHVHACAFWCIPLVGRRWLLRHAHYSSRFCSRFAKYGLGITGSARAKPHVVHAKRDGPLQTVQTRSARSPRRRAASHFYNCLVNSTHR